MEYGIKYCMNCKYATEQDYDECCHPKLLKITDTYYEPVKKWSKMSIKNKNNQCTDYSES